MAMAERMCIVTRAVKPPEELVRFVLSPSDDVTPDLKRKLPGRGVWVSASKECIEVAARKGHFARGFKHQASCGDDLPDLVGRLLYKEATSLISLCNRAGLVTAGFEKVRAQLAKGSVVAVLIASDAGEDGKNKVSLKARGSGGQVKLLTIFDREDLSLALGRTNVVHAAVRKGDLTDHLVRAAERYDSYNG
ncbi:MAG: RNA-binding protein [Alphaproteobacteria bacterium]|nr:RNA-binding protein [Alphaproteobacteria bacterium]